MSVSKHIVIICYGNILRSQVLEQYLLYHANKQNLQFTFFSAGIAGKDEFLNEEALYKEIHNELQIRKIPHHLSRHTWDQTVLHNISHADFVFCADNKIKATVLDRAKDYTNPDQTYTFYQFLREGEKDFEDTYDYENDRQDPVRYKNAFDELERISIKMLQLLK